jgi:hypothetical protein
VLGRMTRPMLKARPWRSPEPVGQLRPKTPVNAAPAAE